MIFSFVLALVARSLGNKKCPQESRSVENDGILIPYFQTEFPVGPAIA